MIAIELAGQRFDLAAVAAIARGPVRVTLADEVRRKLVASRAVVDRHAAGATPIYGLNTGLGGNLGYRMSAEEIRSFQEAIIRGRCIGMGDPLPEPVARGALFCRILGLSKGGAGLSPELLDLMIALLNAGVTPVIPSRASLGAADLGACAHMAAVLIGRGEAWFGGRLLPGAEALAAAGLAPALLGPKDGLSLINASPVSASRAALALCELAETLLVAAAIAALAGEGYAANPSVYDARIAAARQAASQAAASALFRRLLDGSSLYDPGAPRSIQDALSFRTIPSVFGAAFGALAAAAREVETEINAVADNPLVLIESGEILSTPNFHTNAIALAFDTLAIAVTHLATASVYRAAKLQAPQLSGLPKYLSPAGGASTGLNSLQKTAAALHAELRLKAMPASLDAIPVSETVEDHAPQTPLTIQKLEEQLALFRMLLAIEALVAAQAVDLRAEPRLGRGSKLVHDAVRAVVPRLDEDRETGPDAMRVLGALFAPDLATRLRAETRDLDLPLCSL
jgi:histidine ammonia-lyase